LDLDRFIICLRAPSGKARNQNTPERQNDEPRQTHRSAQQDERYDNTFSMDGVHGDKV